ncbi:hypothetical protein ABZ281_35175 [Streptomyces sp. NPDC006265]|uniref:hypothetical protein n=1 Tax=Streptomyces sp. NPDC006265 TaxID=3156740 RepID=UPI0033BA2919
MERATVRYEHFRDSEVLSERIAAHPARAGIGARRVISDAVLDYLRSGAEHGVLIPDAADSFVRTPRVVAHGANARA